MKQCIAGEERYSPVHRGKHEAWRVRVNKLGDTIRREFEAFTLLMAVHAVDATDVVTQLTTRWLWKYANGTLLA